MGDFEATFSEDVESQYEIPFFAFASPNLRGKTSWRQYLVGSFSGALSSQKVTEEFKGSLGVDGNHADSVMA